MRLAFQFALDDAIVFALFSMCVLFVCVFAFAIYQPIERKVMMRKYGSSPRLFVSIFPE